MPVTQRLVNDIREQGLDLSGDVHYLRNNDVRHIIKSHGIRESNSNKRNQYGTTGEDIKAIPYIVTNYTEVYYTPKYTTVKAYDGIVCRLDDVDTVYYVEQVLDDGNLYNKQLIKVPLGGDPKLVGLDEAKKKKASRNLNAADKSGPEVYARSAQGILSDDIVSEISLKRNKEKKKLSPPSFAMDAITQKIGRVSQYLGGVSS